MMKKPGSLALVWAFCAVVSLILLADLSRTVGQSVQKFGPAWQPMYNTYSPSYRQPHARRPPPAMYRDPGGVRAPTPSYQNRGMAYRSPVRKPFAKAPVNRKPLVTSEQYGRAMIMRGMGGGWY